MLQPYSLLTIVRGRKPHLNNLLQGVARQTVLPAEVIVVHINEEPTDDLADPGVPLYQHRLSNPDSPLPLAAARNLAASHARTDRLCFLDVDCIPSPTYGERLTEQIAQTHGLIMGEVRYLKPKTATTNWTYPQLEAASEHHPRRPALSGEELRPSEEYHLFWSLTFGIDKTNFERIGGFDTRFTGSGGEDTDFSFAARAAKVPFYLSGARVYHQHHATCTPPLNHLSDIVTNARAFRSKWGGWPMEGWLKAFAERGFVRWENDTLEVLRHPTKAEIEACRSEANFA